LTGQPTWRTKQYEGKGEVLTLNSTRREFHARGHASLKLFLPGAAPGGGLRLKAAVARPTSENPPLEIFANDYDVKPGSAVFRGQVRAEHPEWKLTCEAAAANFSTTNQQIQRIHARRNVTLEQVASAAASPRPVGRDKPPADKPQASPPPWKLTCDEMTFTMAGAGNQVEQIQADRNVVVIQSGYHATADQALYSPANEIIRLVGNAKLITADGKRVAAPVLILNRQQNTFEAVGAFQVDIPYDSLGKGGLRAPQR
jgi:lipopolysaccharide export system protein LptA